MFHGIEELRKRGDDYVLWRDIVVDHYTFRGDDAAEAVAARELARRCRHLESLDVRVSGSMLSFFEWFEDMTPETPIEYRSFLAEVYEFCEHADGRLLWRFKHEPKRPGRDPELEEIEAAYVWSGSVVERVEYIGQVYGAGIYHALRRDGFDTADCEQRRDTGCSGAKWSGVRAMLERHGLTRTMLAEHVLPTMPAAPAPPTPVASLADAKAHLTREVVRGLKEGEGSLPECYGDINDASRAVVAWMANETGAAWLGDVNRDNRSGPMLTQWDGGIVYNFGASFVVPTPDAELARLCLEREQAQYTTTQADLIRIEAIHARVEAIGGAFLTWT